MFEVAWLTDEQIAKFKSDFRIVADYFRQVRQDRKYVPTAWEIQHVDAVLKLMTALTGNHKFEEAQNRLRPSRRRAVTMVDVFGQAEKRGMVKNAVATAQRLLSMGLLTLEQIAQATTLSLEDVRALRDKA